MLQRGVVSRLNLSSSQFGIYQCMGQNILGIAEMTQEFYESGWFFCQVKIICPSKFYIAGNFFFSLEILHPQRIVGLPPLALHTTPLSRVTLSKDLERRILAFEMKCFRKMLRIWRVKKIASEELYKRIQTKLQGLKQRKLHLFGHICRTKEDRKIKALMQGWAN